jgi:hypothetical protein
MVIGGGALVGGSALIAVGGILPILAAVAVFAIGLYAMAVCMLLGEDYL